MKRGPTVPPAVRRGSVGSRWAPRGPVGTPEGPVWVRTSIVHQYGTVERPVEPCRVLSGPVVPNQGPDGNPSDPDMARGDPTSPDGSLDCPVLMYS